MNRVSCQFLKNRSPQGFYWLLLSVLIVLSAIAPSRAQTPPPPTTNTTTVIASNDDLTNIVFGGVFTFATNGTFSTTNTFSITNDTTLDATGLNVTLTANYVTRLFSITKNATLTLLNLQITGGKNAQGAAIYNGSSTLIASNVTFAGNRATNASAANGANGSSGHIDGGAGGSGAFAYGGVIYSLRGSLILTNCTFTNNIAGGGNGGNGGNGYNTLGGNGGDGGQGGGAYGGAIYSTGTNIISGCYFAANAAVGGSGGGGGLAGSGLVGGSTGAGGQGVTGAGGAIYIPAGGILNVTNSTFSANQTFGGDSGPQSITANGISSNAKSGGTAIGGAIENFGIFYIENSTFFTNSCFGGKGGDTLGDPNANAGTGGSAIGGAICNAATFAARNCTFATNNVVGGPKGISPFSNRNGSTGPAQGGNLARISGTSKISNSILQHGLGADNNGALSDGGYNISSDTSCAFTSTNSLSKTNAFLVESLVSYPGVVPPVLPFKANSAPQDRIPPIPADAPTNFPATDERGLLRFDPPDNLKADVGAFEFVATSPIITLQPQSKFVTVGTNVTFTVAATGALPFGYQWYFTGTNGVLTTNHFGTNDADASITITNVQSTNFGSYFVVITNGLGSVTSSNAVLALATPASITSQSGPVNVNFGGTAVFNVTATGGPLSYQWFDGSRSLTNDVTNHIVGATAASLTINNATKADQGSYHVVVSSTVGSPQTSSDMALTVNDPAITSQPADTTVSYGSRAIFSVGVASSTNNISFIWHHGTNGAVIPNAAAASYTNSNATNSDTYFVVVSNKFGGPSQVITSSVAALTVLNPAVTITPTNLVVDLGSNAVFTATAAGSPTLQFHWTHNGTNLASTNSSLTISPVTTSDAGTYTVTVSNSVGVATSPAAILAVRGSSSISGRISFGTNGVEGVTVTNGVTNSVSRSDGGYIFNNLTNGTYTIAPIQIGSGLTPLSTNIVVDGVTSITNINFTFNGPFLQITSPPTNNAVPVSILSAPQQPSRVQSSTDLTNWTDAYTFTADTNGAWTVTVTNTTAAPEFFLRAISP